MSDYSWLLERLVGLGPLLVALACGGFIGLERETRGKPAGIKTAMLICFGSAAFVTFLVPGLNFLMLPVLVVAGTQLALRRLPNSEPA